MWCTKDVSQNHESFAVQVHTHIIAVPPNRMIGTIMTRSSLVLAAAALALSASLASAQMGAAAPAPLPMPAPMPPPAPAARAPVPAASAAQQVFVIPFRRGATNVDREAEEALGRVVAFAQRNRSMHLMISGLTAGSGSETSRMARAMRMAASVQDYLANRGVGGGRLHTEATGALPNAGAVPAGVSDPAAARVEIRFIAAPGR